MIKGGEMKNISKKLSREIIKGSVSPFIILLVTIFAYRSYKTKIYPFMSSQLQEDYKKYISTIFVLALAFIIHRIVRSFLRWYKDNIAAKTPLELDDKLIPIFERVSAVIIWASAILIILPFYGININALIATLGVASLAIAMAAQDTIANIIAGFLIMVDAPFRIADKIKLPSGEIVEVLDIGVRRSRFLSEDGAIIIVPNLDLSKSKIINYTYGEERKKDV